MVGVFESGKLPTVQLRQQRFRVLVLRTVLVITLGAMLNGTPFTALLGVYVVPVMTTVPLCAILLMLSLFRAMGRFILT